MKVAANFVLRFQQPEKEGLRYLSHAIANHYLQSMPVFKNTLLRDGRSIIQIQVLFILSSCYIRIFFDMLLVNWL